MNKRCLVVLCVAAFAAHGAVYGMNSSVFQAKINQADKAMKAGNLDEAEAAITAAQTEFNKEPEARRSRMRSQQGALDRISGEYARLAASRGAMAAAAASGTPVAPAAPVIPVAPPIPAGGIPASRGVLPPVVEPAAIPVPAPVVLPNPRRQLELVNEAARRGMAVADLEANRLAEEARALANLEAEQQRAQNNTQRMIARLGEIINEGANINLDATTRYNTTLDGIALYEYLRAAHNYSNPSQLRSLEALATRLGNLLGKTAIEVAGDIDRTVALGRQGVQ